MQKCRQTLIIFGSCDVFFCIIYILIIVLGDFVYKFVSFLMQVFLAYRKLTMIYLLIHDTIVDCIILLPLIRGFQYWNSFLKDLKIYHQVIANILFIQRPWWEYNLKNIITNCPYWFNILYDWTLFFFPCKWSVSYYAISVNYYAISASYYAISASYMLWSRVQVPVY